MLLHAADPCATLPPLAAAAAALLYPLAWPHPLVPTLPRRMAPLLEAPTPFLLGLASPWLPDTLNLALDDVVVFDADRRQTSKDGAAHFCRHLRF